MEDKRPVEPATTETPEPAAVIEIDPKKLEAAAELYAEWRNAYLNELPTAMFNRLEAASPFLIEAIAAQL
jgi:hypothetical protein